MKRLDYTLLAVLMMVQNTFIVLRVNNIITWSWLIVFSPILAPLALFLLVSLIIGIYLMFRLAE